MKVLDFSQIIKLYKKSWLAIDQKTPKVVAHANTYKSIVKKISKKRNIVLLSASDNYFGFVT